MMNLDYDDLLSMQNKPVDVQGMYYSNQRILLVGEGNFSFSSSLATQFGVANNIVATSLDSREDLQKKYQMHAIKNIDNLTDRGAQVFHSVNARDMAYSKKKFDVIIFNFPHAGFFGPERSPEMIRRHKKILNSFFTNAAFMLSPGGLVYVSHKCDFPYNQWDLPALAKMNELEFMGSIPFCSSNFPGYKNCRGDGKRAGKTFELGKAAIYIFAIRCSVWIDNIEGDPMQTQNKDKVLQTFSSLRSFKEKTIKNGRAFRKTPLLQIIAAEIARLETLKLQNKQQRELNFLKMMLKVMHLVVETKTFAIHRITGLLATSSYKKTEQSWRRFQRLALEVLEEAFEEEQNIKLETLGFGASNEGEGHTLLPELCAEQNMCDSTRDGCPYEQQCELQVQEVLEIHVSDDTADETLLESEGEENEGSFCAFVLETQMPGSTDQDVMDPENIVLTGRLKIEESNHMSTIDQEDMSFQLEYQSSDEDQTDMPDFEAFGVCELSSGDMEDMEEEDVLVESNHSLAKRISNWISKHDFSCFGTISSCFGTTNSYKEIHSA